MLVDCIELAAPLIQRVERLGVECCIDGSGRPKISGATGMVPADAVDPLRAHREAVLRVVLWRESARDFAADCRSGKYSREDFAAFMTDYTARQPWFTQCWKCWRLLDVRHGQCVCLQQSMFRKRVRKAMGKS